MKSYPAWLVELHRQWYAARGKKLGGYSRAFARSWGELLDAAGITSAEDCATALREAAKLHDEERLVLVRNKYRNYLVECVSLPLSSEPWLRGLFESPSPAVLRDRSIETIRAAEERVHPRFPLDWSMWVASLRHAFEDGRSKRPLSWNRPVLLGRMLDLTFRLTAEIWSEPIFIREVSIALGLPSKELERSRRLVESCLGSMFGRPVSLEMLGIAGSLPRIEIAGELTLHFDDCESGRIEGFRGSYHLTSDLMRATKATTPAKRILTIENSKTTLRRIASLNGAGETLILAGAYPSQGLRRLIAILPADLPVYHFGDTDPAGFLILAKLRKAFDRTVYPFLMERRVSEIAVPLSGYDRSILPSLLDDPLLADVRPHLEAILTSGDKGSYEQEALGIPDLSAWPFYRCHPEAKSPEAD